MFTFFDGAKCNLGKVKIKSMVDSSLSDMWDPGAMLWALLAVYCLLPCLCGFFSLPPA